MTSKPSRAPGRSRTSPGAMRKQVWAEFVAGDDTLARRELPTEILRSWYRCRDLYRLDPVDHLKAAADRSSQDRGRRWDDTYTQLGGSAAALAQGVGGCVTAVTDANGN